MRYLVMGLLALVLFGLLLTGAVSLATTEIVTTGVVVVLVLAVLEAALHGSLWASARRRKGKAAPTGSAVAKFVGRAWVPAALLCTVTVLPWVTYTVALVWSMGYVGKKFTGA